MINRNESRLIAKERRNLANLQRRKSEPSRKPKPVVYPIRAKA